MSDIQITDPNGNIIIAGTSYYSTIRIFNPEDGTLVRSFSQNNHGVDAMTLLPNGHLLVAAASYNSTIRILNPEDGTLVQEITVTPTQRTAFLDENTRQLLRDGDLTIDDITSNVKQRNSMRDQQHSHRDRLFSRKRQETNESKETATHEVNLVA